MTSNIMAMTIYLGCFCIVMCSRCVFLDLKANLNKQLRQFPQTMNVFYCKINKTALFSNILVKMRVTVVGSQQKTSNYECYIIGF